MTALTAPVSSSSNLSPLQNKSDSQLFAVETDFSLDGAKQSLELQVTLDGLQLVDQATGSISMDLPWRQVESIRTVAGVGSGLLQVKTEEVWTDLLRFSNRLATRFHKVARCLERMRESDRNKIGRRRRSSRSRSGVGAARACARVDSRPYRPTSLQRLLSAIADCR